MGSYMGLGISHWEIGRCIEEIRILDGGGCLLERIHMGVLTI